MVDEELVRIRVGEARRQGLKMQRDRCNLGLNAAVRRTLNAGGIAILAALFVGMVIGVVGTRGLQLAGPEATIVEGYAWMNKEGTAIGLSPDGETPGKAYTIAGAMWREQSGPWHDTLPSCLEPLVAGQRVRLGVLDAGATRNVPHRAIVVWLECLN